jgi:spore coat protein U-like protein
MTCQWVSRLLAAFAASSGTSVAQAVVTCLVSTGGSINFNVYNPLDTNPTLANSAIEWSCTLTSGGATTVTASAFFSPGNSAAYPNRFMVTTAGAGRLNYNLYRDALWTQVRGNGTAGTVAPTAAVTLTPGNPTSTFRAAVYGRIPAGQDVRPGNYTDSIVVTFNY